MSEQTCNEMEKCTIKPTPSPTCAGMWEHAPTPTPAPCDPIKEESEESDEPKEESDEPKEESDKPKEENDKPKEENDKPKEEPKEESEPKEKIAIMTWDQTKFLQNILNIVPTRVGFTFEEFDKIKPLKERIDGILMVKMRNMDFKMMRLNF